MNFPKRMTVRMFNKGKRVEALRISKRMAKIRRMLKGMIEEW